MKKFESIYTFDVLEQIKKGKKVFMLDREEHEVECTNLMSVGDLLPALDDNTGRYVFWMEIDDTQ